MGRAAAVRAGAVTGTGQRRVPQCSAVIAAMAATRTGSDVGRRILPVRSSICGSRSRAARRLAHIRAVTMVAIMADIEERPAMVDRVQLQVTAAGVRRATAVAAMHLATAAVAEGMRPAAAVVADIPAVAAVEVTPAAVGIAKV